MPRGDRNPTIVILRRRERIEELLEQTESPAKIVDLLAAEGVKVSRQTVERDIAAVAEEWRAGIVGKRHIRQMRKVRAAERRNAELQAEWERSKLDKQRRREKAKQKGAALLPDGSPDPNPQPDETEAEQSTEGQIGNVALMAEQRKNDEFIARMLRLEEPKDINLSGDIACKLYGFDPDTPDPEDASGS